MLSQEALSSHDRVDFGGRSMSCLVAAKHLCHQTLMLLHCMHRFFDDKVAGVRASTDGADSPTFTTVPVGCELQLFTPVSSADVVELVKKMSDKQCTRDPLPT